MTDYPNRPTFLLTKGQRLEEKGVSIDDLEYRYVQAYISRFQWEGLPEGCPLDYPERMIYYHGGLSGKRVKGLGVCVMGAAPSSLTLYGTPKKWLPRGVTQSADDTSIGASINKESTNPVLWDDIPMASRILPYLEAQRKALNSLNQNLAALCMPIIIETAPGMELKSQLIKQNLGAGDVYIQAIEKGSLGANVLDMKASDHTQNLISTIHDCDNTILDMMHIRASMEKTSGVSDAEATASVQQINDGLSLDYEKRKKWAEAINAVLGTNITVRCAALDRMKENVDNVGGTGNSSKDNGTDSRIQSNEGPSEA